MFVEEMRVGAGLENAAGIRLELEGICANGVDLASAAGK